MSRLCSRSRWQNREAGNQALPGVNSVSDGCDGVHKGHVLPRRARRLRKNAQKRPTLALGEEDQMGVSHDHMLVIREPRSHSINVPLRIILPHTVMDIFVQ